MTEGPLDNYFDDKLSAEEKAYFNSRGSEHAEEKAEEAINAESDNESNHLQADETASSNIADGDGDSDSKGSAEDGGEVLEEQSDEDDEPSEERTSKADRDYEKAFKTERHKRKELKEALEAQARKTAEMETVLNQLRQNAQQQQTRQEAPAPQEAAPDPEDDPLGYLQHQIKQQERVINEHNKYLTERHQAEQRTSQENAFRQHYINSAKEFTKKQGDFAEAYNFLTDSKVKEYIASGFSPEQANGFLLEDEMALVTKAYNDKVNPAERIYNLAKNRGYAAGSGEKKGVAAKNVDSLKRGLANSKSLKSGGGQPEDKELGIDDIDRMNFDEFDAHWAKLKASSKGMG